MLDKMVLVMASAFLSQNDSTLKEGSIVTN